MPLSWYSTGVLDGDDLVLLALDLGEGRVQGGGLARAGGSGHEHHPVRLADEAPEAGQLLLVEAEDVEAQRGELLGEALLVEDSDDGVLAVDGRHDGHAEVDGAASNLHAEAPVLGHALLGDVQLGHDLHAADDRRVVLARDGLHGRLQHAVDAVLDHHLGVPGLDVDVRGAPVQGVEDRGVHELDDGRGVGLDLVHGQDLLAVLLVVQDLELEGLRGLLQDPLRALAALQRLLDRAGRAHRRLDGGLEDEGQLVHHRDIRGVGHDQDQAAVLAAIGQEVVTEHEVRGHRLQDVGVRGERCHVHVLQPVPHGQRARGSSSAVESASGFFSS
jgi:hypothetical protein